MYVNNAYFGAQCIWIGTTLGYLEPQGYYPGAEADKVQKRPRDHEQLDPSGHGFSSISCAVCEDYGSEL